MGGAIAVRVAAEQILPTLIGLIIIDVVEGRFSSGYFSSDHNNVMMVFHDSLCLNFFVHVYVIQYNIIYMWLL